MFSANKCDHLFQGRPTLSTVEKVKLVNALLSHHFNLESRNGCL